MLKKGKCETAREIETRESMESIWKDRKTELTLWSL
jgi:hypothetical protein